MATVTSTTKGKEKEIDPASSATAAPLFKDVIFFINDSIKPAVRSALTSHLINNGAHLASTTSSSSTSTTSDSTLTSTSTSRPPTRFNLETLTHLITDSLDFPEYHSVKSKLDAQEEAGIKSIVIVTPYWVTRSLDNGRIMGPRFYSADKALIFSGLCFCSSELPDQDNAILEAGVKSLGGDWKAPLTREVTHLFVVAPHGAKYERAMEFGPSLGMVVLLPEWFEECIRMTELISTGPYTFPRPAGPAVSNTSKHFEERLNLLKPSHQAATLTATLLHQEESEIQKTTRIYQETSVVQCEKPIRTEPLIPASRNGGHPSGLPDSLSTTHSNASPSSKKKIWPDPTLLAHSSAQIFSERHFYLCSDLGLCSNLEAALKERIEACGGKCWSWSSDGEDLQKLGEWERRRKAEREMRKANTFVMRYREGWEYWHAYTHKKTIGNIAWMYHVLASSKLSSPLDRLLHYPTPHTPIPGIDSKMVITISNYAGPAREYIRTLISTLGATFDGSMSKHTDFVITASSHGQKVKAAEIWSIPCLNHYWLEACLLSWSLIEPSHSPRYNAFTTEGNFTTVLGNTPLPFKTIEKWASGEREARERREALELPDGMREEIDREVLLEPEGMELDVGEEEVMQVEEETREEDEDKEEEEEQLVEGQGDVGGEVEEDQVEEEEGEEISVDEVENLPEEEEEELHEGIDIDRSEFVQPSPPKKTAKKHLPIREDMPTANEDGDNLVPFDPNSPKKASPVKKPVEQVEMEMEMQIASAGEEESESDHELLPSAPAKKSPLKSAVVYSEGETGEAVNESRPTSKKVLLAKASVKQIAMNNQDDTPDEHDVEQDQAHVSSTREPLSPSRPRKEKVALTRLAKPLDLSLATNPRAFDTPPSKTHKSAHRSHSPLASSSPALRGMEVDSGSAPMLVRSSRKAAAGAAAKLATQMVDANKFAEEQKIGSAKKRKRDSPEKEKVRMDAPREDQGEEGEEATDVLDIYDEEAAFKKVKTAVVAEAKVKVKVKKVRTAPIPVEEEAVVAPSKKLKKKLVTTVAGRSGAGQTQDGVISSFDNPPHAKPPMAKSKAPASEGSKVLIFTGTGVDLESSSKEVTRMRQLGAIWTDHATEANVLVVKGIMRTEKFLLALSSVTAITTVDWVTASLKANKLLDVKDYPLHDKKKEKHHKTTLVDLLARARSKKLYDGLTIYLTESCQPAPSVLRKIIMAHGGTVNLAKLTAPGVKQAICDDRAHTRVISCETDKKYWQPLAAVGFRVPIYSVEVILEGTLQQRLLFDDEHRVDGQMEK